MKKTGTTRLTALISRHKILTTVTIVLLGTTVYGLKSYLGINILEDFTLGSVFPFNHVKAHVKTYLKTENMIVDPHPGIVCQDDFEKRSSFAWKDPTTVTNDPIERTFVKDGLNGSWCLRITNPGTTDWKCEYKDELKVRRGEAYDLECYVMTRGSGATAYLSLVLSGEDRNAADREYDRERIENSENTWVAVRRHLVIGEHSNTIRPRLSGSGKGDFLFDNVILRKL